MATLTMDNISEILNMQQKAYRDTVEILFESVNKRVEGQNMLINDLRRAVEHSQHEIGDLKTELKECRDKLKNLETSSVEQCQNIDKIKIKTISLEDHSRRRNIRIEGLDETSRENWEQTQIKVEKLMKERLEINNIKIDYAHRINKKN